MLCGESSSDDDWPLLSLTSLWGISLTQEAFSIMLAPVISIHSS
ncbi:hypothetical protein EV13_1192 [Prochlorococcus sp. MIT 0702]|nr:hypothetical protein EV12_2454 [Prochlorococcus sp. MIT 0701]KGG29243.1 hypothetical protein EV13_1192 [Prochlorococcus sp. MIT 0702]KGG35339.1 hypothetical protein EV14_0912 [Prochlorococcus sp. MIT 0703]